MEKFVRVNTLEILELEEINMFAQQIRNHGLDKLNLKSNIAYNQCP